MAVSFDAVSGVLVAMLSNGDSSTIAGIVVATSSTVSGVVVAVSVEVACVVGFSSSVVACPPMRRGCELSVVCSFPTLSVGTPTSSSVGADSSSVPTTTLRVDVAVFPSWSVAT